MARIPPKSEKQERADEVKRLLEQPRTPAVGRALRELQQEIELEMAQRAARKSRLELQGEARPFHGRKARRAAGKRQRRARKLARR